MSKKWVHRSRFPHPIYYSGSTHFKTNYYGSVKVICGMFLFTFFKRIFVCL
jgi:hypothetical protein